MILKSARLDERDACIYTILMEMQCVCTSLRMVTRSVTRLYDRPLSQVGLRVTGYSILSRLAEEGPLTASELARRLAMDRTTCTREVAPLVESGLVETTTGSDRRHRLLGLTDRGARKRSEAYPLWERVQRMVADDFGDAEVADLLARLYRLRETSEHLSDVGVPNVAVPFSVGGRPAVGSSGKGVVDHDTSGHHH
jgi:DNA-binding MarR family transcriptional regulator